MDLIKSADVFFLSHSLLCITILFPQFVICPQLKSFLESFCQKPSCLPVILQEKLKKTAPFCYATSRKEKMKLLRQKIQYPDCKKIKAFCTLFVANTFICHRHCMHVTMIIHPGAYLRCIPIFDNLTLPKTYIDVKFRTTSPLLLFVTR